MVASDSRSGPRTAFVGRKLGLVGPNCHALSLVAGIPLSYGGRIESGRVLRPQTRASKVPGLERSLLTVQNRDIE